MKSEMRTIFGIRQGFRSIRKLINENIFYIYLEHLSKMFKCQLKKADTNFVGVLSVEGLCFNYWRMQAGFVSTSISRKQIKCDCRKMFMLGVYLCIGLLKLLFNLHNKCYFLKITKSFKSRPYQQCRAASEKASSYR